MCIKCIRFTIFFALAPTVHVQVHVSASLACTCIGDARSVTSEEMHVHVKRCGEEKVNGVVGVHRARGAALRRSGVRCLGVGYWVFSLHDPVHF